MPNPMNPRDEYLERVKSLYDKVKHWMNNIDPSAQITEQVISIHEEPIGNYAAPALLIDQASRKRIQLIPRG
ncbi:MAG: hypothetical protein NTX50_29495, partial [Candidatus Sumerlaeota bacterium]|nr:hypothetical protein [Candidatus Sumerlaeota bacterium]